MEVVLTDQVRDAIIALQGGFEVTSRSAKYADVAERYQACGL